MLDKLKPSSILVLGDVMLDSYTYGDTTRVSPEAPVLILKSRSTKHMPGGAGNVALNLATLGASVTLFGRIGQDGEGALIRQRLEEEGILTDGLIAESNIPTIVKHRLIAANQQLLRIDTETIQPLHSFTEQKLIDRLDELIPTCDTIAISDYGKGFLTGTLLRAVIDQARCCDIPVLVDPKGMDFKKYTGATLIKPNQQEAYAAARVSEETPLEEAAHLLFEQISMEALLVTRGEKGMTLFSLAQPPREFPVLPHTLVDVTGAGDTVLALLALSCASRLPLEEGIALANAAASLTIEQVGCTTITLDALTQRLTMLAEV